MFYPFKRFAFALVASALSIVAFAQETPKGDSIGDKKGTPNGWHLKDRATSGYYGISLDKAYQFLKGRKSKTVVVAVIDSGIDTTHEDLRSVLWVNPKEVGGNGKDDDRNGYADDIHGYNFLGGKDGRNVKEDSYESARVYHRNKARFEGGDTVNLSTADKRVFADWKRAKAEIAEGGDPAQTMMLKRMYPMLKKGDSAIAKDLGKEEFNGNDLKDYTPKGADATMAKNIYMQIFKANNSMDITNKQLLGELEGELRKADAATTAPKDFRGEIAKDNENDINDRNYGNNDIMAGTPFHGTHVSGIIAGDRTNGKGIDGIADNVKIMMVRAVPDGDEHDKDIANAIRYAVDNGAKVVNMSFGKPFSPQKQWVDDAVKYAQSKGVLLVHAAGNDAKNLDSEDQYNFPTPVLLDGSRAQNWIEVGASGDPKNGGLAATFSNYGKNNVDLFAPGRDIYSTIPGGNTYGNASGTSMASPVTVGVAALVLEYFPTLTPVQLKYVLEQSVVKVDEMTNKPGSKEQVRFSDLSRTGGIVNAYEAVKLADQLTKSGKWNMANNGNTNSKTKITTNGDKTKVKTKSDSGKVKVVSTDDKTKIKGKSNDTKVKAKSEEKKQF